MASIPSIPIPAGATLPTGGPLSNTVKTIINSRNDNNGKITAGVPTAETIADLYGGAIPASTMTFDAFINALQNKAKLNTADANTYLTSIGAQTVAEPSGSAFNNCNGKWTEQGYAIYAWNALAQKNRDNRLNANGAPYTVYMYVKLPNRTSVEKDWTQLLVNSIITTLSGYPAAQSNRIPNTSSNFGRRFELISSNPDSVILKFDNLTADQIWNTTGITIFDLYTDITAIGVQTVIAMDSLFEKLKGKVLPSQNLQCFLSVKRSTRPDRRYQWVHEGDHVKTILQWIQIISVTNPALDPTLTYNDLNGKFFAVSLSEVSDADTEAMNTGLAGSIVSPSLQPQWAVDKLFECRTFDVIANQIEEMINFH